MRIPGGTVSGEALVPLGSVDFSNAGRSLEEAGRSSARSSETATSRSTGSWRRRDSRPPSTAVLALAAPLAAQTSPPAAPDLYRLGSSRDFGVAWRGRAEEGRDRTVSVASVFGAWDLGEKLSLLARVDRSFDGIPDAGDIPYLGLAEDTELDLLLVGLDYRIHEMVSVIPNVEAVADRETGGIPAPDDDLIARLTLSGSF